MTGRRMDGALNLIKPPGMTSHDVVDAARRALGERRVGHTGTLDPLAAGVLVLLVGRGTRAARYFLGLDKRYRAEALFGLRTDTGDLDGVVVERRAADRLAPEAVRAAAAQLTGRVSQRPPAASAVRVGGERLYRRARRGEQVEVPPRAVRVHRFELVAWFDGTDPGPRALFDIDCSSGTYVRSLIEDLGRRLGTAATTSFLLRTRVGPFTVEDAATLEELQASAGRGVPPLIPLADALGFLPALRVDAAAARDVVHGRPLAPSLADTCGTAGPFRILDEQGRLLAVARGGGPGGRLRYDAVFAVRGEAG